MKNNDKLNSKFKNYKKINTEDLLKDKVLPEDMIKVRRIVKKEIISYSIALFIIIFSLYCWGRSILTKQSGIGEIISFVFFLIFLCFGISLIRELLGLSSQKNLKAQYGVVRNKYYEMNSTDFVDSNEYYLDVNFPCNKTYINKVECSDITYKNLDVNQNVLVFSFRKSAYAVLSKR